MNKARDFMDELLTILENKRAEFKAQADAGNVPHNHAWVEYRLHFLEGFNSAISCIRHEIAARIDKDDPGELDNHPPTK